MFTVDSFSIGTNHSLPLKEFSAFIIKKEGNISITEDEDNTQVDKQVAEPSNGETVQGEAECDGIPQKLTISMSDGARLFCDFFTEANDRLTEILHTKLK